MRPLAIVVAGWLLASAAPAHASSAQGQQLQDLGEPVARVLSEVQAFGVDA